MQQDDAQTLETQSKRGVRNSLIRTAITWTPFFVAAFGAFLFFLVDTLLGGDRGTTFLLVVLGFFSLLFGSQAIQAWLDLLGSHVERTGQITRRWKRRDSIVMATHYIRLDHKEILRGDRLVFGELQPGDHAVVRFYRHSAVAFWAEAVERPEIDPPADGEPVETAAVGPAKPEEPPRERKRAVRPEF